MTVLPSDRQVYECHITFTGDFDSNMIVGWKYSKIDGDPILGSGVKQYLTKYYSNEYKIEDIISAFDRMIQLLTSLNCKVLRTKIELIVYDNIIKQS